MRLVKDRVVHAWREMKTDAAQRITEIERKQKAIRGKLDHLHAVFLYERSINIERYDRHRDKLREELTLAQRLQQLFFPDGMRFDGKRIVGTGTTLPVFNYLGFVSEQKKGLVDLTGIEPVTS